MVKAYTANTGCGAGKNGTRHSTLVYTLRAQVRGTMKLMLVISTLFLASLSGQAQKPVKDGSGSPHPGLESKVRAVWQGFEKKDKAAVAALLADDFRTIEDGDTAFGDKKKEVDQVDTFTLDQYSLTDLKIKPLASATALVTYTAEFSGKDSGQPVHARGVFGEVWVKRGGDWKCVYSQETALH